MIEKIVPRKIMKGLRDDLSQLQWKVKAEHLASYSIAATIIGLIIFFILIPDNAGFAVVCFVPLPLAFLIPRYAARKRSRKIEQELSGALYHASSLASFTPIEEIFETLACGNYGPLSKEFEAIHRQVKTGVPLEDAVEKVAKRNKCQILTSALNLFILGYQSGTDISAALRDIADNAAEAAQMQKERAATLIIEKWTLLLAAGVIVPLVLGIVIFSISSLELGTITRLGFGKVTDMTVLINTMITGNQIYIAVYAILAAIFVASQEKRIENALIYTAVLLPLSIFLYNAVMSSGLLLVSLWWSKV